MYSVGVPSSSISLFLLISLITNRLVGVSHVFVCVTVHNTLFIKCAWSFICKAIVVLL